MRIVETIVTAVILGLAPSAGPALADGEDLAGADVGAVYRTHPLDPDTDSGGAAICSRLGAIGWGPDYVAGVDAVGRAVAPADLGAAGPAWSPVVTFDVPVPRGLLPRRLHDATAGTVTVDTASGLVAIDGTLLNPSQHAYLRSLCARR